MMVAAALGFWKVYLPSEAVSGQQVKGLNRYLHD